MHAVLNTKGCGACHLSHSADQKNLLVKAETPLCLSCHDSGGSAFKKAHGNYPVQDEILHGLP